MKIVSLFSEELESLRVFLFSSSATLSQSLFLSLSFISYSLRAEWTYYAIMGWITVIWFIRLLQITAILQTPTTGCHLWDRKPLVERSLIWPSPGMSEPIMALMKQTEVRKRRKDFFFSVFFSCRLASLLYKSVAWWVKTHVKCLQHCGLKDASWHIS